MCIRDSYELGGSDGWDAFTVLPPDKPAQLPEGIALYQSFDPGNESACRLFDLSTDCLLYTSRCV